MRLKKILGFTFGGLQKKMIALVMIMLSVAVVVFIGISFYQNKMLVDVVETTRVEQEKAISQVSEQTMHQMMEGTLAEMTSMHAKNADNDFKEVINCVYMMQTMAQGLFENRASIAPAEVHLPDRSEDGEAAVMVLHEKGVDYTKSEDLGVVGHMSASMIAMLKNYDKISACYIGLADGTHLAADTSTVNKYDENGKLIPFPVRDRPWYKGAVETGGLYFTGIEPDAFSGEPGITCSAPVVVDGKIVGVVGADVILDNLNEIVRSANSDGGGYVSIVSKDGEVIASSITGTVSEDENSGQSTKQEVELVLKDNPELAQIYKTALQEATDMELITVNDRQFYMAGAPMPSVGWAVISAVDKEVTDLPEKQMLAEYARINEEASGRFRTGSARSARTVLLILAAIFAAGACAALFAAGKIVKPIEQMTRDIIRSGITGELFKMKDCYRTDDEIELLAESFDEISRKTRLYIEEIKEITREKERVSTELKMANLIQSSMLPHIFPAFPDRREFDLYAAMDPAKEVGGDFYDFFLIDDDHLCMVMADVSGKGIPAALFMMISKVILQSCAMLGQSTAEILNKTNEALCSSNQVEMFVTVWLGIMEISTGKVSAANAGHEYPILKKGDRFEMFKDRHGFVIGGMDGIKYKEYQFQMEEGDKLFLYTDGVPEATDAGNNMFGIDRMIDALNQDPEASPQQILINVRRAVDGFVQDAEQFDDLTMLCMEYKKKG